MSNAIQHSTRYLILLWLFQPSWFSVSVSFYWGLFLCILEFIMCLMQTVTIPWDLDFMSCLATSAFWLEWLMNPYWIYLLFCHFALLFFPFSVKYLNRTLYHWFLDIYLFLSVICECWRVHTGALFPNLLISHNPFEINIDFLLGKNRRFVLV